MKHTHEESEADTRVYTSTTLVPDARTAFARLYLAWKARGQPKSDFLAFVSAAGYDVPLRTLDEWVANVRAQGSATSLAKASGRPQALSQNTVRLIVGLVLDRNEANVAVHLDTVQTFVRDRLGLDISLRSLSNDLHSAGFSSQVTQNKAAGFKLDVASLCRLALHWLRTTPLDRPRSKLCSVDFAFSGHRKDLRSSWSPVGGAQPKSRTAASTYTSCIMTGVWADGKNRTPAMLFTYNQKFRRDRSPTKKRQAEVAYLDECLRRHAIGADRIDGRLFRRCVAGCYLLSLLDGCNKDVCKWFDRNLQLKEKEPTLEKVEALIKGERVSESEYYKGCLSEYRIFMGQDTLGDVPATQGLSEKQVI